MAARKHSLLFLLVLLSACVPEEVVRREPGAVAAPRIVYFRANPPTVMAGDTSTLEWRTDSAETVEISDLGPVPPDGARAVDPQHMNSYRLTARNQRGETVTEDVTIMVAYPQVIEPQPGGLPTIRIEGPAVVEPGVRIREPSGTTPQRVITPGTLRLVGGLPAPTQRSPGNGTRFGHYPRKTRLRWAPVQSAKSYTVEVQYCGRAGCATTARPFKRQADLRSAEYTFDFVGAQPGRWRVWAVDGNGKAGLKSGWWEFRYTR